MPNITKEDFKQDLQELVEIENQKQMNLAVLFENSLANSKEIRLTEFKDRLYIQANYYNTLEKYQLEIDDLVTQYKKQLDKLFDVCSTRYINIQRELATAVQSEIIVVTNISINKQNLEKAIEENDAEKIHYYTNKINASIQKKLNYETIVNECNSRLEACIDQISDFSEKIKIEENINVAKKEKNRILEFFNKLIKNLNKKKNYEKNVLKPSENHIERLTDEVDKSIGNLYNQIFEFAVQMKDNKDKINMAFNAMMQG